MNTKTNALLDNMREQLEAQLGSTEGDAPALTEAEQKFCDQGLQFIEAAGYEIEVDGDLHPEAVIEALEAVAAEDDALAPKVEAFFGLHKELFAEA